MVRSDILHSTEAHMLQHSMALWLLSMNIFIVLRHTFYIFFTFFGSFQILAIGNVYKTSVLPLLFILLRLHKYLPPPPLSHSLSFPSANSCPTARHFSSSLHFRTSFFSSRLLLRFLSRLPKRKEGLFLLGLPLKQKKHIYSTANANRPTGKISENFGWMYWMITRSAPLRTNWNWKDEMLVEADKQ